METAELSIHDALAALRGRLASTRFPLESGDVADARRARGQALAQLDDYILPRLDRQDAPLLAVVGGSTGAGKSTLVNTLVGRPVTETGVRRPTTRSPVLIHHPDDAEWFDEQHVLSDLPRVEIHDRAGGALRVVADDGVPAGVALLDAPDIDSVVAENRALATQLVEAADLWMFVTTAARYSDAVPWDLLAAAAARHAAVAVVLDRVAPEAVSEVRGHLASMLTRHGLGDAPLLVVEEGTPDGKGLLPAPAAATVRGWLHDLAADDTARTEIVLRTLGGAVGEVLRRVGELADASDRQREVRAALESDVARAYGSARTRVDDAASDGSLVRGEALARWREYVGTVARAGRGEGLRGRAVSFLRGRPQPALDVGEALEHALAALVVDEAEQAATQADHRWRENPAGAALLGDDDLSRVGRGFSDRAAEAVRAWRRAVLELVRSAGVHDVQARPHGVEGVALALTIAAVSPDSADGAAAVARRILSSVVDDETLRRLAAQARSDLSTRVEAVLVADSARFTDRLADLPIEAGDGLRSVVTTVELAQEGGR
ncbi:dynamin family protein [Haloactinopolyspora alba]|uniref:Dynamin family protein n=1 Tax=Haloactinopolyspora alba TaxID=648780 RepID=A0A2P8DHG0_9ACTN|nr:dynamin family protein [Haloactinopolyspora alba]PSK96646.1 dynamin family protein [Haloactinopolyspora alba]